MESLERRNLLAGDVFHNYLTPGDVNNDNHVSALDALTVINHLNQSVASGGGEQIESSAFADVNDDGHTSAIDALMVINQMNRDAGSLAASGEELQARLTGPSGERAKVEVDNEHGILKFSVKIQNALPGENYEVAIGGSVVATLVTNARGRASLETSGLGTAVAALAAGDTVSINGIGTATFIGEGSSGDHHHEDHGDNGPRNEDQGDEHQVGKKSGNGDHEASVDEVHSKNERLGDSEAHGADSDSSGDDLSGNISIDNRLGNDGNDGVDRDHDHGNVSEHDDDRDGHDHDNDHDD